ncbi:RNA-guided endonuclease TnpB family protein [Microcoleus sp. herbarium2]|uniref:RNA-guided endonuclease TnpB family protein n=1 Tax=Microcoleus sp. herbarium2 TaxID=3055433 RepID=UPI002FD435C8
MSIEDVLKIPKIGEVKAKLHRRFGGKLKTVTISMGKTGKYYASLLFDDGLAELEISLEGKAVGIEVGLTHFAIIFDGSKFDNPKPLKQREKNLMRKQHSLSRKEKGSKRRGKARRIVAGVHESSANTRKDFQHKLSRKLVNDNQVIVVENLAVKNVVKHHCFAKAISDCGWSEFTRQLKYKAQKDGKTYLEIGRFFPLSKICHVDLNYLGSLLLNVGSWTCFKFHEKHDRDVNAAIKILPEGLRIVALATSATASGGNVRPHVVRNSSVSEAVAVEARSPRSIA